MFPFLPVSPKLLGPLLGTVSVLIILFFLGKVPIGYNLRNLAVRWRTTFLTALAFTLVVSLLTVLLAFVKGMDKLTEGSGQPGNVMVLSDGATDELFSTLAYNDTNNVEREKASADPDGRPLKQPVQVEQVERGKEKVYLCSRETYLVVNQPIRVAPGEPERRRFVQVRGLVDAEIAGLVHGIQLEPGGSWFSDAGVRAHAKGKPATGQEAIEAVLGAGVARVLGPDQNKPNLEVNDEFELGDRKWVVAGILQSAGSTFDSEIWAKQPLVGPMFRKENYTSIVLRTPDAASAKALASHLTKQFKTAAVQAQPETEYYAKLSETNQQFLVAIIFVSVVMAIGGVFGVMNTMFAAISQRTKDIAVLRILGFARRQILISFFLETMVIALVGGLLGCALGSLVHGHGATSIVGTSMGGSPKSVALKLIVDGNVLGAGLLFTLIMGVLGGLLPALSAMRLKPLESLR
jgi:ABC-type antimicrobial peptide transport system permease subunit